MKKETLGIIGGGQLGRMLAGAAYSLGYDVAVLSPKDGEPACKVATHNIIAEYNDESALSELANISDVITYEFENIPSSAIDFLEKTGKIFPSSKALYISQNRLREKDYINSLNVKTAEFYAVETKEDIKSTGILKTTEFGYDGKGQWVIDDLGNLPNLAKSEYVLESFVPFDKEISVIVARSKNGEVKAFEPSENIHKGGILRKSIIPANIDANLAQKAKDIALKITKSLDLVGLLAVEFFVLGDELLVNEVAPRPHNSGHWTMNGCVTSQFEQHVRAVFGLPLGGVDIIQPTIMENLIGDDVNNIPDILQKQNAKLHLYGKVKVRDGRKMGHVNYGAKV